MVSYRFDLYPRTDPRDGTLIRSFTHLQKAAYRAEANGTSTGQIAVRSTTDDGQAIDPLGLQYVRVVELPGGSVRGGFFLEKGKFAALTEDEDSLLTFSGAGTLSYLSRASMAPHSYLDMTSVAGNDPYDDTWRLYAQGPVAGGDFLGAVLWRVIIEALSYRSGATYTHRHTDGTEHTDAHDDDRTQTAIPAVVMTFDAFEDSSGNAWTLSSGEFKAQVGENVLSVVKRLMEAGLYVELDPDTFELNAWEQDTHRAMLDATGSAWATDVVRFQSPTDPDDITTGNIKDDANRNIEAHIKRSALWAGGGDVYGLATSPGDIPWEGHYRAAVDDTEALEGIAAVQLAAIAEAGDTLKLRLWMEDDPANGRYLPWDHVLLDQQVTVHTGTDQWEFDERTFPVAALTVELKPGGNWDCIVELGASYSAAASRQFQVQGVGAHTHPPNPRLCQRGTPPDPPVVEAIAHGQDDDGNQDVAITVGSESDRALYVLTMLDENPTAVTWYPGYVNAGTPGSGTALTLVDSVTITGTHKIYVYRLIAPAASTVGTSAVRIAKGAGVRAISGVWCLSGVHQTAPESAIGKNTGSSAASSVSVAPGDGDWIVEAAGWVETNATVTTPVEAGDNTSRFARTIDRSFGLPDYAMGGADGSDSTPAWNFTNSHPWGAIAIAVNTSSAGTAGSLPQDIGTEAATGSSNEAARCDHVHAHPVFGSGDLHPEYAVDGHTHAGGLSDDTPLVESGSGSAGTSDEASRSDHVHPADAGGGGGGNGNLWTMAKSSSQTLTNNTDTLVTFDTAHIDGGGSVIDLANERFVVPASGFYLAIPHWQWEGTAPGSGWYIAVRVNGTAAGPLIRAPASPITFGSGQGSIPVSLAVNDLVTMYVNPGAVTGVSARGNASANLRSTFTLVRIT